MGEKKLMSTDKNPSTIKLFGATITLPWRLQPPPEKVAASNEEESKQAAAQQLRAEAAPPTGTDGGDKVSEVEIIRVHNTNAVMFSVEGNDDLTISCSSLKGAITHEDENSKGFAHDTVIKRPKQIVQCPRCHSMNTKFCYYNNRNLTQPRYLCKSCRRNWTVGGALRDVPIGAGDRKSKHCASRDHAQQIRPPNHGTLPHGTNCAPLPSATCQDLEENTTTCFKREPHFLSSITHFIKEKNSKVKLYDDNKAEPSNAASSSSLFMSNYFNIRELAINSTPIYIQDGTKPTLHSVPFNYPMISWTQSWNLGWTRDGLVMEGDYSFDPALKLDGSIHSTKLQWTQPNTVTPPRFFPPFPFRRAPTSFYGSISCCPYTGVISDGTFQSSTMSSNEYCSVIADASISGKHPKLASLEDEDNMKFLWAPKIHRIDETEEAAKTWKWESLAANAEITFKAFQCDYKHKKSSNIR